MEIHEQLILSGEPAGRQLRFGLSMSASIVVSFLILFGITQARQTDAVPDEPPFEEIRSVVLPAPPPPPPTVVREVPLPTSLSNLEVASSESTIAISVSPSPIAPSADPPVFEPVFDFSANTFKPSTGSYERRYVYQKSEVDQPPVPVYKKVPGVNLELMGRSRYAKVSLLYIVNTSGRVEGVKMWGTGGEEFDNAVMNGVQEWRFRPAVKDGEKVNCWVRQSVVVKAGSMGGSPFR